MYNLEMFINLVSFGFARLLERATTLSIVLISVFLIAYAVYRVDSLVKAQLARFTPKVTEGLSKEASWVELPTNWTDYMGDDFSYDPYTAKGEFFSPSRIKKVHFSENLPEDTSTKGFIPAPYGISVAVSSNQEEIYFTPAGNVKLDVSPMCLCMFSNLKTVCGMNNLRDKSKLDDLPSYLY